MSETRTVQIRAMLTRAAMAFDRVLRRALTARRDDRGDVNGYVFVTLMTAGIVMVIWVIARDRLAEVFDRAITSVTGP